MSKNFPLNIKILSVGGRGANILERLSALDKDGIERIAVGVNSDIFSRIQVKNKIELAKEKNLDKASDIEQIIRSSVEEKKNDIEKALKGVNALFIVGNLANNTSQYQIVEIAKMAKENDILTFFIGNTPFSFEGKNKIALAQKNKEFLESSVDAVLVLESDKTMTEDISAVEAMTKADKLLVEMISSVVDIVLKFGIINVDFADLKSTIQNAGEVYFNAVNGAKNETENLINDLFTKNELTPRKSQLSKALYVVYAGKDILMEEINAIGSKLKEHFNDNARIIFGVVNEDKMAGKLKIVMIGC